ncbi:protein yellow-like [Rhopalosiphum padi]|uniref:protein yellow-like n=1 Tax=Rhopalosiphum padi TaxID=40932 RepID=UPI00298E3674|nr:protein yellow-like [Rhopalosiphum padi]
MMSAGPSSLVVTALLALHHVAAFTCNAQRQCSGRLRRNATDDGGRGLTWTGAQYRFECDTVDALLRDDGRYVPRNNIALRAQICGNDLYLAYPRLRSGVPATVATTCLFTGDACEEAVLTPFPCLSVQEQGKSGDVQNAVDVYLDAQEVLWILDTGIVQTLDSDAEPLRTGPPTVWAFDLNTRKLFNKIDLTCLTTPMSRLQYLVVDYDDTNGKCYVYVSDAANRAIIAYDVVESKGSRVVLPKAIAAGCTKRDVLYVALVRAECGGGAAALIVTYLSGIRAFTIRTEYLRQGSAGKVTDLGVKPDRMVFLGTDGGTKLLFRYDASPDVQSWDTALPFTAANISPVYRSGSCFLATQVMVDQDRNRLMVLESNFPDFIQNTVGCGIVHNVRVLEGCF